MVFGGSSFRLFRWRGVDVFMDLTALIIIFFYIMQISSAMRGGDGLLVGVCVGVMIMVSILVHELSHAWVGMLLGAKVERIQLSVLGGVCVFRSKVNSNWRDFLISVAGPASNFAIYFLFNMSFEQTIQQVRFGQDPGAWVYIAYYVAQVNFLLGVFNMLPGFPLDGGQALRSLILFVTRREMWAAWAVAVAGCGVGLFLGYWAVQSLQSGNTINVIFLALIGFWVVSASIEQLRMTQQLTGRAMQYARPKNQEPAQPQSPAAEGVPASVAVKAPLDTSLNPRTTVIEFNNRAANWPEHALVPVLLDGYLAGVITRSMVKRVAHDQQAETTLERVMVPRRQLQAIYEDDDLAMARLMLRANRGQPLAVLDRGGAFVGFITPPDLEAIRR